MTQQSTSRPGMERRSALASSQAVTGNSAMTRAVSTKPSPKKLQMPDNCRDVTLEKSGTMFALVGPPFRLAKALGADQKHSRP